MAHRAPQKNEPVVNALALLCGDVAHNLRSALDYVYWEIVSPHCVSDDERRRLQFPVVEEAHRLDVAIQQRLAHRAGTGFYCALRSLRPHGEPGGNELLYLIHEVNILDKHKLLVPTVDYKADLVAALQQAASDFPFTGGQRSAFSNISWKWRTIGEMGDQLGRIKPPTIHIYERQLDFPVDVILHVRPTHPSGPLVPVLNSLVDAGRQTIAFLREGANSC